MSVGDIPLSSWQTVKAPFSIVTPPEKEKGFRCRPPRLPTATTRSGPASGSCTHFPDEPQIGVDIGRKGLDDEDIIPLLHRLNRPTFFTLDVDFWDRNLRHEGYCLAYLDISHTLAAV